MLFDNHNMRDEFDDNFVKWMAAIIMYCKETQKKSSAIQEVVSSYSEDLDIGAVCMYTIMMLII